MPPKFAQAAIQAQQLLGVEIIYSFIIIISSLMIYFGTKELYELSKHKGIKYFRESFLFFAFAFFFRSAIKFYITYFNIGIISKQNLIVLNNLTTILFMYFSIIAIFYLIYSIKWKQWNNENLNHYILHVIAATIAIIIIITAKPLIYLIVNLLIVAFAGIAILGNKYSKKNKNSLRAIYILLFTFLILNIFDILIPNILQTYQLFIYLASIGIFLSILYKVLKKTGA